MGSQRADRRRVVVGGNVAREVLVSTGSDSHRRRVSESTSGERHRLAAVSYSWIK